MPSMPKLLFFLLLPLAYVVAQSGAPAPGARLFGALAGPDTCLVDDLGQVIHSWPNQFPPGVAVYLLEDGTLLRSIRSIPFGAYPGGAGGGVQRLALDGTVLWDFRYDGPGVLSHHDIELLPNGNVLMIAWEDKTVAEAIASGRDPALISGSVFRPDHIIEVQPTGPTSGAIVWEWHVWDHLVQDFDAAQANYDAVGAHPELVDINYPPEATEAEDFNHSNSLDYDEEFDLIIMSARGQNEIWIIDHGTTTAEAAGHTGGNYGKGGDLLYRWGNPAAYAAGTAADQQLFGQHAAVLIPDGYPATGDLMIFNNNAPGGTAIWEIALPQDATGGFALEADGTYGPAGPVWSYSDPTFVATFASNAERLPNGNTLFCSASQGEVREIDANGQLVWSYSLGTTMFHVHYVERTLWSNRPTVSLAAGGTVQLDLIAGSSHAGDTFVVLGSASGTSPGFPVGGVTLPLVPDFYTQLAFAALNTPSFAGSFGALQPLGREKAFLTVAPGSPAQLAGVTLHHAFLSWVPGAGSVAITGASNAVPLTLVP